MIPYAIALHGGAGTIDRTLMSEEKYQQYVAGLDQAADAAYKLLEQGASAIDAVECAVKALEDCPLFNAGKGAVFNHEGKHEMDAAIMNGIDKSAGAVSALSVAKNPIEVARAVMEKSPHVLLTASGADAFAIEQQINTVPLDYFYDAFRYEQWQEALKEDRIMLDHSEKKMGTVGAVALDQYGNLAAATSTGGMTNKKWGRVGDSPIIGAGTWADNKTCAISCTGHGELFIRSVVAYDIACLIEYKSYSLKEACDNVVYDKLVAIGGEGGLVAIDAKGNIELPFNSDGMYRAYRQYRKTNFTAIYS